MSSSPPIVLAFAATDPTGGAGLQADVLTAAAMGCHALSVVTGLTVQDSSGVHGLHPVAPNWVRAQADALLAEMPVAAFKLGVLGSAENAEVIAALLARHANVPVVLDPVLASGRGDPLADEAMITALRGRIAPHTTVATPNSVEARRLGGVQALLDAGCRYVLVTGTHDPGEDVANLLHGRGGVLREDRWPRLPGSYHGSGCTLACAIAAGLARGLPVAEAVREAQRYTWQALAAGFRPAAGQFLPDRFFMLRKGRRE